jgi:Kef-type K+ transport system membrane component KefB
VIFVAAHLTGALMRRIGQPQVVGEMLAGIALGPSLLGAYAPALETPHGARHRERGLDIGVISRGR